MTRIKRGLKVATWIGDEIIIRQRIKILDDEGSLIGAPTVEARERRRGDEPLEEVKKRAEEALERELREAEKRLGEKIKNITGEK